MNVSDVILIRGLPGSGKSTMAKVFTTLGYLHLEADQYFIGSNGQYEFNPALLSVAHRWCHDRFMKALFDNRPVVVSNTFSRRWEIDPYIFESRMRHIDPLIIETHGNFPNIHGVPPEKIEQMKQRWEAL